MKMLAKQKLSNKSKRYWMASVFLLIIVAACVGLIVNRQWELDAAIKRNFHCTRMVVDLKQNVGLNSSMN